LTSLAELQSAFGRAVLAGDFSGLASYVRDDGISAAGRIGVYRNNVATSLTLLLAERFPVVERLVGDGYFSFAAERFRFFFRHWRHCSRNNGLPDRAAQQLPRRGYDQR